MDKIGLPKFTEEVVSENQSKFIIEPLYPGYGPTLGNALRRVLLSSITGAAATSFKIDGVSHEFSSIPHVKEDMIQLMIHLKGLNFKMHSDEPITLELTKKGPGEVTAADFKPNSNIEISNPSHHILSLDNKASIKMELFVEKDRGFRPASIAGVEKKDIGQISIDASFSPIERVSLDVSDTRVGQMTNYDKLTLTVITNGSITPKEAIQEAAKVLVDHYSSILEDAMIDHELTEKYSSPQEEEESLTEEGEDEAGEIEGKTRIEDANFLPRTTNALLNAGIKTIAGLRRLPDIKLEEIKGLGKKGITEIKDKLGTNE